MLIFAFNCLEPAIISNWNISQAMSCTLCTVVFDIGNGADDFYNIFIHLFFFAGCVSFNLSSSSSFAEYYFFFLLRSFTITEVNALGKIEKKYYYNAEEGQTFYPSDLSLHESVFFCCKLCFKKGPNKSRFAFALKKKRIKKEKNRFMLRFKANNFR